MSEQELLQVDVPVEDEVVQFITEQATYTAYTGRGLRLDITRANTLQPAIQDPDDFHTYMWVEARQGFFLLSQRFVKGEAQRWVVYREFIPKESHNFYIRYGDEILKYIESHPSHL